MSAANENGGTDHIGIARRAISYWAVLGGVVLLGVVLINMISVIGGIFWVPFPGDFEITEMGVAIAVFSFLPYCQLTGANVSADLFTARASPRMIGVFSALASAVALLFALLLTWRMFLGMLDQQTYNYTTAILQLPIWMAYIPALISLVLLAVAAVITLREHLAKAASGGSYD